MTDRGGYRQLRESLTAESVRFLIVGAIGFWIDAGVTYIAIHGFASGEHLARLPAFLVAVTCVWLLNRHFTFEVAGDANRLHEWGRFIAVYSVGALINFTIYAIVLHLAPRHFIMPLLGMAAGQVVAMIWNFFASRSYAFQKPFTATQPARSGRSDP